MKDNTFFKDFDKVLFEDFKIRAECLANTAMAITAAMFDSDMTAADFETAMRYFTENLVGLSLEMTNAFNKSLEK